MTETKPKVELLAPAGNFEKLEIAIHYGANAVYLGGKNFSLRNFSGNFTREELQAAVKLAHHNGVKVYVACNMYARNDEQPEIVSHLKNLGEIGPDAVIIADPGIFRQAREIIPQIPVHLSTQVNTTNYQSVLFWENQGTKRINVARELSLKEIREIASHSAVEIEAFVHGAMCISYSGRCLLSSFMAQRDSNRGMCTHPCRWRYAVVEETRPGKYMPLAEDDRGAYIFNSRDLCMVEHIPEMIASGITSLKIEGRMKGINYLASAVRVYRAAIDKYYQAPASFSVERDWIEELTQISNRGYCTGFYFGDPDQISPNYSNSSCFAGHVFVGKVLGHADRTGVSIQVRNKIFRGDGIEVLPRQGPGIRDRIDDIVDADGRSIPFAQPETRVTLMLKGMYARHDLIRRPHVRNPVPGDGYPHK